MGYGIKVSKKGKSVSSTTPTDFILNSDWATIKFLQYGAGSKVVAASSTVTETISHSYGFFPMVVLFVELTPGSGRWYVAPFKNAAITGEDTYISGDLNDTGANSSQFKFKIVNTTAAQKTISYYYFIIGETGK